MRILNPFKDTGAQNLNQLDKSPIEIINLLALITSLLVFLLGGIFFLLVHSLLILIPLLLEGFGMLAVIWLNVLKKNNAANFTMFAIHYIAAGYWTTLLGNAIPIEVVVAFLLIFLYFGSFLIYKQGNVQKFCLAAIVLLLIFVYANSYFKVIRPLPIQPTAAYIMRVCTTGGMLVFILYILYYFVQRISDLLANLRKSNSALTSYTAFLCETFHEIKTPLNAIHGGAQLLNLAQNESKKTGLNKDITPEINNLLASSTLAKEIVNNVLDLKRVEEGKFHEVKLESVDLPSCIESCIKMNQYIGDVRKIKISLNYNVLHHHIEGDKMFLTKIINNLISNAVKFSTDESCVLIDVSKIKNQLSVKVKNEGEITQEKISTLFQPYNSERNNFVDGTGIGLYLTKQLVELLGGQITVQCEAGVTIFEVTLPFKIGFKSEAKSKMYNVDQHEFMDATILIIDDNLMNQSILQNFVKKGGAKTIISNDGKEGLAAIIAAKPDVIISDAHMPVMTGKELLLQIRSMPEFSKIPFIVISGDAFRHIDESEEMLKSGADAYFQKPLSFQDLYLEIVKHLPKKAVIG